MSIVDEHKTGYVTESNRVEFNQEQQTRVQELIDETYRKAYVKASKEMVPRKDMESMTSEIGVLKEDQKVASILRALSRHNVVDAGEVSELIRPHMVQVDNGGFAVEEGNNGGGLMAIDEYVDTWLSERPHHLRSSGSIGGGSRGAFYGGRRTRQNLSDPSAWRTMPRDDLDKLLSEGVSVQGLSGQVFKFKDVKNPFLEAKRRKIKNGG